MRSPWFWILMALLVFLAAIVGWRVGLESGRVSPAGKVQRSLRRDGLAMRIPRARKPAARPEKDIIYAESPEANAALRALEQRITVPFDNTPLDECMKRLAEMTSTTVTIDLKSLEDEGIDPQTKVSISLTNVQFDVALRRILEPLQLCYWINDDGLEVLSSSHCGDWMRTALFPVGDLVTFDDDHEILMELLRNTVDPDSWEEVGGPATMYWVPQSECLTIRQSWYTHCRLRIVLRGLREAADVAAAARAAASAKPEAEPKPVDPADPAIRTSREILQENIKTLREVQRESEEKPDAKAK